MIVELIKAAVFLFPFLKELFLGKSKDKDEKGAPQTGQKSEPAKSGHFLRQTLITVAIVSVIGNAFFVQRIFSLGSTIVSLKREITAERLAKSTPQARPSATVSDSQQAVTSPTPQEIEEQTPKAVDPAPTPAPEVPVAAPVVAAAREEHKAKAPARRPAARQSPEAPNEPDEALRRLQRINEIR